MTPALAYLLIYFLLFAAFLVLVGDTGRSVRERKWVDAVWGGGMAIFFVVMMAAMLIIGALEVTS